MDIRIRPAPLRWRIIAPIALGIVLVCLWWLITWLRLVPATLLPSPEKTMARLGREFASGRLWAPLGMTLLEAGCGCALASAVAVPIAYFISHIRIFEAMISPYLAASQAIPAVALAPLLVIWAGYGTWPVVLLCSFMVFFPMVLATALGLRSIDREVIDAAAVDGADRLRLARWIEWPLALPATLTGLRNGFTLSITGAVVGELVMGGKGLGQRLAVQAQSSDTTGLFTTLIVLCFLAVVIYLTMMFVEWLANPYVSGSRWRHVNQEIEPKQGEI